MGSSKNFRSEGGYRPARGGRKGAASGREKFNFQDRRAGRPDSADNSESGNGRDRYARGNRRGREDYFAEEPAEKTPAELRAERRRMKALEQAQAPLSPEQEAALKALSLFLDKNADLLMDAERWVFFRAHYHESLFVHGLGGAHERFAFSGDGSIICEQSSMRAYRILASHTVSPKDRIRRRSADCMLLAGFDGEGREAELSALSVEQPWQEKVPESLQAGAALILGTSSKAENYVNFARAVRSVRPGGWVIFTIANSLGAASLERIMASFAPIEAQLSKYHCRVFGIKVPQDLSDEKLRSVLDDWNSGFAYRMCEDSGLLSRPGIFSWNKLDGGSELLCRYLAKAELSGAGADLGSANGCLSKAVLESEAAQNGEVSRIDLFEDEYISLAAAKKLLKDKAGRVRLGFFWADVVQDVPEEQYDWIVMNPPFHQGQTRVLNLGREFVASAARALTWRGVLYVVVNRTLPYEETLETYFGTVEKVDENNGFKVFKASCPVCHSKQAAAR